MKKVRKILAVILGVLVLVLIICIFVSCNSPSYHAQVNQNIETGEVTYTVRDITFHVVEIDGCEYLIGVKGYSGFMAPKVNSKCCETQACTEKY